MEQLREILHSGNHTLVVRSASGEIRTFDRRGVADLYELLTAHADFLHGAEVADKVVGRAAASLMLLGGVRRLHTDVISSLALTLFADAAVEVEFDTEVPHIINRAGDGWCPLETRCKDCRTPDECFGQIESFMNEINKNKA